MIKRGAKRTIASYLNQCKKTGTCWIWQGAISGFGYPVANISGRGSFTYLHRWIYEQVYGPIQEGFVVDHMCNNPKCLNPNHLQSITRAANIARNPMSGWRGYHKRRTKRAD